MRLTIDIECTSPGVFAARCSQLDILAGGASPTAALLEFTAGAIGMIKRGVIASGKDEASVLADLVSDIRKRQEAERLASMSDEQKHAAQCHPDWDYETEVTGRKQDGWRDFKAEGWTPNVYVLGPPYDRNWCRDDFTDTAYWMRKKS